MQHNPDTKRVFSGVQPSGRLHIGNYIGALSLWVELQESYETIFCIVDLHALTIPERIHPASLHVKTREMAALYVACGLDPAKNTLFIQSHLHQHAELAL
jgi:tryptophanyl-tRNA synthetase